MLNTIVFLGAPGCGKGTQASIIQKKLGYLHVSTGDLLRQIVTEDSEFAQELKKILSSGDLVSDELVNEIIDDFYSKNMNCKGIILDGYPRNILQAKLLDVMLKKYNSEVTKVIFFELKEDTIIKRIVGRYTCDVCNAVYNKFFNTSKVEGECDICHNHQFNIRSDDTEEVVRNRLKIFHDSTEPLLKFYNDKLVKINADQALDAVSAEILMNL